MRLSCITASLFVLLSQPTRADTPEETLKGLVKTTAELTGILKSVTDKATAEAAVPKLKVIDERYAALKQGVAALRGLPAEERTRLQAKHKEAQDAAGKTLRDQLARLDGLPGVTALLRKESPMIEEVYRTLEFLEQAKRDVSKLNVQTIDRALLAYRIKFDEFPKTLKVLTEGASALLEAEALLDPWGKPFQYDPAGPKNKGEKPDVWTVLPDKSVIGNWREDKK